jgi:tryptophan synthase alpha chain
LLIELAKAGADISSLGVPFSDPVADGEVIQRASERALAKRRDCARRAHLREETSGSSIDVPIVLFSYFNPLLQFGRNHSPRQREKRASTVCS